MGGINIETLYKITCIKNNKYYIGSTSNKNLRFKNHFLLHDVSLKQNNKLHDDIKLYGESNFVVEILEESNDKVLISRLESEFIRKNNVSLSYNKALGASGRRVFYRSDIEFIRNLYNETTLNIFEAYDIYYKRIVTFRSFKKVWHGDTFKDIMYDVYNQNNKAWHFSQGRRRPGEKNGRSKVTEEDVKYIRMCKEKGELNKDIYNIKYKNIICKAAFDRIWNNISWKHI